MDDREGMDAETRRTEGTSELVSAILVHCKGLVQTEYRLARSELKQNGKRLMGGVALIISAAAFCLAAVGLLSAAAMRALMALGWPMWVAAFVTGVKCVALAALFFWCGASQLKPSRLLPQKTLRHVKSDLKHLKEALHV